MVRPIRAPLRWCSQKFWIDNCVAFVTALALVLATWPLPPGKTTPRRTWVCRSLLVGAALGASLWSKATAAFSCPGTALVSYLHLSRRSQLTVRGFAVHAAALAVLALATHLPWVLWCVPRSNASAHEADDDRVPRLGCPGLARYHEQTGRWLPSALPSASMLSSSPLVAAAVTRPWHFYPTAILSLHPSFLLGFLALPNERRLCGIAACCGTLLACLLVVAGPLQGGAQLRFALPISPLLAVLTGAAIQRHR